MDSTLELEMECLDRTWEHVDGNMGAQFVGNVRFILKSLEHVEVPTKVFET